MLGLIVLVLLAVAGFVGWRYFQSVNSVQKSEVDKVIKLLPPPSLDFNDSSQQNWRSKDKLAQDEAKLQKIGCNHQGYYSAFINDAPVQYSFWNFKEFITIAISEASTIENELGIAQVKYLYEALVKIKNGGSLCVTTSDATRGLPRDKKYPLVLYKSNDVIELIKKAKAQLPDIKNVERVKDSKQFYLDAFYAQSEWLWQEPQLRSNELQVLLTTSGIEVTDELMQSLVYYGRFSLAENIEAQIRKRFPVQAKLSDKQWQEMRDRVVIIHEKMPATLLSGALYEILGMPTQSQEEMLTKLEQQEQLADPIKTFHDFYEKWNLKYKAKCIAKSKTPVNMEVYIRPQTEKTV